MKLKKLILITSVLGITSVASTIAISCNITTENNELSKEINKITNSENTNKEISELKDKKVSDYFKNVTISNDKYKNAKEWIDSLNKALENKSDTQLTFNRSKEEDQVDIQFYANSSSKMKDIINVEFIKNANNEFSLALFYNLRATIDQTEKNKINLTIGMYNSFSQENKITEMTVSYSFMEKVNTENSLNNYEKISPVLKVISSYLEQTSTHKNEEKIKNLYNELEKAKQEAQKVINEKINDLTKIETVIKNLNDKKITLENALKTDKTMITTSPELKEYEKITPVLKAVTDLLEANKSSKEKEKIKAHYNALDTSKTKAQEAINKKLNDKVKVQEIIKELNDKKLALENALKVDKPTITTNTEANKETKEYEKITPILSGIKTYLTENDSLKNVAEIKPLFDKLSVSVKKAEKAVTDKIKDPTQVQAIIKELNDNKKLLEVEINKHNFKGLITLIKNIESNYAEYQKDESIPKIKKLIDELKSLIQSAKEFINLNKFSEEVKALHIKNINNKKLELDKNINGLEKELDNLLNKINEKIVAERTNFNVMPNSANATDFKIKNEHKLEGSTLKLSLHPNNAFGRLSLSGEIKYGKLNKKITEFLTKDKYSRNNYLEATFEKNMLGDLYNIKNTTWNSLSKEMKDIELFKTKLDLLLAHNYAQDEIFIKNNNVILFAAAFNWTEKKDADIKQIIKEIKSVVDDTKKSKLEYFQEYKRWNSIRKFIRIFSYANNNKTGMSDNSLKYYREDKTKQSTLKFFTDLINNYFNDKTELDKGKWALFEFYGPFKILEIFNLLEKQLTEDDKNKTFNALNKFVASVAKYSKNTGNLKDTYLNKPIYLQYTFIVKNYVSLYTQNIEQAIIDATDYSLLLENFDTEKLFDLKNTKELEKDLEKYRQFTNFFIDLSKIENLSDFGVYKKVNLEKISSWVATKFLEGVTMTTLNQNNGQEKMLHIGLLNRFLQLNPKYSKVFQDSIKSKIIINHKENEFTNLSKIKWDFIKNDWKTFFNK
ncbi:hypothetical protein [Mycoplasmopsis alligatoris]|uniref:Lipoprotein n=1 Tax=Mycoplasmopsis alligatoris A21JP2 TaxID=747682 RepID=D4XVD9_9BACT|nr:hypothetical protein [Mycoplasmopsis alligatoris]EFF41664.1 hypothetical protein MALL_0643 [Mycoplasmopsis alligatoris A21JP2]